MKPHEVVRRRVALLLFERDIRKQGFARAAARTPAWVPMFLRGDRPFPFERIDEIAAFFQHTSLTFIAPLTDEEAHRSAVALKQLVKPVRARARRANERVKKRSVAS